MKRAFAIGLAGPALFFTPLHAADLSSRYDWKPMKIGGGGWVTGLDIHATEKGLMYARTDVSGAYRRDPGSATWKQIITAQSLPAEYIGYGRYPGVESLVGAPSNPAIAYLAYKGQIFRSTNRGDTWSSTSFARNGVEMEPNGEGRQDGERLAVDPKNSDIVYFGSIAQGLWKTIDAGKTWLRCPSVPAGEPPHGVNSVVFGPDTSVFATVNGIGVFRSKDMGKSWQEITAGGPPKDGNIRDAEIGSDGNYYLVHDNAEGAATGAIWQYRPDNTWHNITPQGREGGNKAYKDIAVDPTNPNRLVVMRDGGWVLLSEDGGATWTKRHFRLRSRDVAWLGQQENYWLSVGELAFDPSGRLWFAEGFAVWYTDSLGGKVISWQADSTGIEETCGNDIIAPPDGQPVGAAWDVGTFRFSDPDIYSAQRGKPYFMSAWALDWCAADPKFLVAVFRNHLGFAPHINEAGYSPDGGESWLTFPAVEKKETPEFLEYGVIAVSADSADNIVWSPAAGKLPWHTKDRGKTWHPSSLGGTTSTGFDAVPSPQKSLCSDRINPRTFYLYHHEEGVFRSTDGGANFTRTAGSPPKKRYNSILKASTSRAGELWFAEGSQENRVGGLWRSTDGGENWEQIPFIEQAFNFGFGRAREEGGPPTIFAAGVANGETGIYRSTDDGETWDKIGTYPLGIFDWIDAIDGDKQVFGRVYLAFTSAGFAYGVEK